MKRLLALVLCLALVIGCVPPVFAEDTQQEETVAEEALALLEEAEETEAPAEETIEESAEPEETEAPAVQTEAPVLETEAPVPETEAPAVQAEAPVKETEAPVETVAVATEVIKKPALGAAMSTEEQALRTQLQNEDFVIIENEITLSSDLEIIDKTLRLETGSKLTVPSGITLRNLGSIHIAGGYLEMKGGTYIGEEDDHRGYVDFYADCYPGLNGSTSPSCATNMDAEALNAEWSFSNTADAIAALKKTYAFQETRLNLNGVNTLNTDITVPSGVNLCIDGEYQLTIPEDVTVTVGDGAWFKIGNCANVILNGRIVNNGAMHIWEYGKITGDGEIENNSYIQDDTNGIQVKVTGTHSGANPDPDFATDEASMRQVLQERDQVFISEEITLSADLDLMDKGICLLDGSKLIVPAGITLHNAGWIDLEGGYLEKNGTYEDQGSIIFHADKYAKLDDATNLSADIIDYELRTDDMDAVRSILSPSTTLPFRKIRVALLGHQSLTSDLEIPSGKGLCLYGSDCSLGIPDDKTLAICSDAELLMGDASQIYLGGRIVNNGTLSVWSGSIIDGSGEIENYAAIWAAQDSILVGITGNHPGTGDHSPVTGEEELHTWLNSGNENWTDITGTITLTGDLIIPEGKCIGMAEGATLEIPQGFTLINRGGINLEGGVLVVNGQYIADGGYIAFYVNHYPDGHVPEGLSNNDLNGHINLTDPSDLGTWMDTLSSRYNYAQIDMLSNGTPQQMTDPFTVPQDAGFSLGTQLTVPNGVDLTINGGMNIWEDGELILNGTMYLNGQLEVQGTISGNGKIICTGSINGGGSVNVNVEQAQPAGHEVIITTEQELHDYTENGSNLIMHLGANITLTKDVSLNDNVLYLEPGFTLTVPAGFTLENSKAIEFLGGELVMQGAYTEKGHVQVVVHGDNYNTADYDSFCPIRESAQDYVLMLHADSAQRLSAILSNTYVPKASTVIVQLHGNIALDGDLNLPSSTFLQVAPGEEHVTLTIPTGSALTAGSILVLPMQELIVQGTVRLSNMLTVVGGGTLDVTAGRVESHRQNLDGSLSGPVTNVPIVHNEKATVTKATLTANGKITYTCSVCNETTRAAETIYAPKTFTLSANAYTYDGKVKTPGVTVKNAAGSTLAKDKDYTVTYASGRKNVGSYNVVIKGKGNYAFSKTLTFKINPVKTAITRLAAGSRSFKVTWAKKAKEVTGYEIQYSLKKDFSSPKKATITKYSTTSKTITGLTKGKLYYVRIRTYKTVGKTKFYSGWSAAKSIRAK